MELLILGLINGLELGLVFAAFLLILNYTKKSQD